MPKDLHRRARVPSPSGMLVNDTHPLVTPRVRKHLLNMNFDALPKVERIVDALEAPRKVLAPDAIMSTT